MRDKPLAYTAFDSLAVTEDHGAAMDLIGTEAGAYDEDISDINFFRAFASDQDLRQWNERNQDVDDDTFFDAAFRIVDERYADILRCPFCSSVLRTSKWTEEKPAYLKSKHPNLVDVASCPVCAWWVSSCWVDFSHRDSVYAWGISRMRRFGHEIPEECSTELAQYIRAKPDFLHDIDPRRLELLVRDIFRANRRAVDAIHVGGPGDRGVDVIYVDEDGRDWLIQVKRRESRRRAEPFSTVQSLAGALLLHGKLTGIVISTAPRFSKPAMDAAASLLDRGVEIQLADKGILYRMLEDLIPDRPWMPFINQQLLEWEHDEWNGLVKRIEEAIGGNTHGLKSGPTRASNATS